MFLQAKNKKFPLTVRMMFPLKPDQFWSMNCPVKVFHLVQRESPGNMV